jgi:hypothetical protein
MSGGEHQAVLGDYLEHEARLGGQLAVLAQRRHGLALDPAPGELRLHLGPDREVGAGRLEREVVALGLGVGGGHPDDAGALARGDLDRERVHPPDRPVEDDRPERGDPRHDRADDGRPLGGRGVVRLHDEAGQPDLLAAPREPDVVDAPLDHVGGDVDVHVDAAADQLARA